jgi:hypothetical protein
VGKKIKGCKRQMAVDMQGNLLAVIVHSAGIQDRVAARAVLMRLFCRFDSISTVFAGGGYTGKLIDWAKDMFDYSSQALDRRTHIRLAQLVTPPQQRLRNPPHVGGNHDIHRLRAPAPAPITLVSGQVLKSQSPKKRRN